MGWLGHTWSLSVEEQFYLTWPLVFVVLMGACRGKHRVALWVGALLVGVTLYRAGLSLAGVGYQRLYNGSDTRADALLMGCLGAYGFHLGWASKHLKRWATPLFGVGAAFLVGWCVWAIAPSDPSTLR